MRHVPSLAGAVEAFLVGRDLAAATRRTYRQALTPLVEALDGDRPVTGLDPDRVAAVFAERWDGCAAATWNTRRVAVQAFTSWCAERWPLGADPLAEVAPRRRQADNTRAIPLEDLEELWRRRSVPLREKTLWRMLYETAARTSEILALDVEDLDRARRRARIRSKGGSTDMIVWAAPTARLLGRYLTDRTGGPPCSSPAGGPAPNLPSVTSTNRPAKPGSPTAPPPPSSANTPEGGPSTNSATRPSPTSPKQAPPP